MKRGDMQLVNLDPTIGSKIKKSRPCGVVSPAELNDHLRTVMLRVKVMAMMLRSWP